MLGDQFIDGLFAMFTFRRILRKEDQPGRELAGFRKIDSQVYFGNLAKKLMRQSCQDTGAVAGVGFTSTRSAMIHVAQDFIGIQDDLVTGLAFDMRYEANTTRIFFETRIVQALGRRKTDWIHHD